MRYLPTSDQLVERLKKQAKKLQRKGGGKHADLLNRVAKSAGYDHWHHVVQCNGASKGSNSLLTLKHECNAIADAELAGEVRVVMTGPELGAGPFVLFSTGIGDAWMIDPEEDLAMCLVWRSQKIAPDIRDDPATMEIHWHGEFELLGDYFRVKTEHPEIGERAIAGYPLDGVRQLIDRALSVDKKIDVVIGQADTVEITSDVIAHLVKNGYAEAQLLQWRDAGFRYSPGRDSVLSPIHSSDDDLDVDEDEHSGPVRGPDGVESESRR